MPQDATPQPLEIIEEAPFDSFDLAEPVKVLEKVPANFQESLDSTKWKDRKDALDELNNLLRVPKIEDGSYGSLIQQLSKRLADANVLVVISAAQCLENFSKGLRKSFAPYRSEVIPALLERFKEKKQNVIEAIKSTLDTMGKYSLPTMFEMQDLLTPFLAHKNPQVKSETLLWLSRSQNKPGNKKDIKSFLSIVLPTIDDSSPEVRDSSIKLLASMISVSGQANVMPFLDTLDKAKQAKLIELTKAQPSQAQSVPIASNLGKQRSAPPATPAKSASKTIVPPTASALGTPTKIQPAAKQAKKDLSMNSVAPLQFRHSDEEALSVFEGILRPTLFAGLTDTNWKTRLESVEELLKSFSVAIPNEINCELLVRFIGKRPGWKESNFQVYQKMFQLVKTFAGSKSLSKESISLMLPYAVEKLVDAKVGPEASELLLIFSEFTGFPFLVGQVGDLVKSQKNPKNQSETLKWLKMSFEAFGSYGININELSQVLKVTIGSSNPLVRTSSISLIALLRQYFGPDVRSFFSDLPSPLLSSLDAELDKVSSIPAPKPTRKMRVSQNLDDSQSSTQSSSRQSVNLADLIERIDVTTLVPSETIAQMSDSKWQTRKEALDQIASALNGRKINLNSPDLLNELKGRFADSNKNLVIQALELTGFIGEACGSAFEKQNLKIVLPTVLSTLSDNKIQVRQAAIKCLDDLQKSCRASSFIPSIINSVSSSESPNLRKEALIWISNVIRSHPDQTSKEDLIPLVSACITFCLQDRTMEVRKAAQALVSACLNHVPADFVKKTCQEQKPAMISIVQGLIDTHTSTSTIPSLSQPSHSVVGSGLFLFPGQGPNSKALRAEKDRSSNRWNIEFANNKKEMSDYLKEQMNGNIHGPLLSSLFSDDPKDQLNGIGQLDIAFNSAQAEEYSLIVQNLDLLLKYITLRFLDTNMTVLLKTLDLLDKILTHVDESNARLTEHEAACLLPHLIAKSGETKDTIRSRTKAIFRQLCRIYPASKLFGCFVESLRSKSAKVRVVCLEEMASLLGRNGLVVINPPKHIPLIAGLVSDRDSAVRSAGLDVLARLVGLMGDQISKYLSELGPKEMGLLEERLKHRPTEFESEPADPQISESGESKTSQPQPQSSSTTASGPFSLEYENFDRKDQSLMLMTTSTPKRSSKLAEATPPYPFATSKPVTFDFVEHPLDRIIHLIQTSADLPCIQSLQRLEEYLSPVSADLKPRINALTAALCVRLHECLVPQIDADDALKSRLCRYVCNALVVTCTEFELVQDLLPDTLIILLSETLTALTSLQLLNFADNEQLQRALNVLLVKVLEGSGKNNCYNALLVLLEQAFRVPPNQDEKYPEFIMKCLWKMTKQIPAHLDSSELNISKLLLDIHNFFCALPPLEWKTRANHRLPFEDLPLRTVKTILHELVVVKGVEVLKAILNDTFIKVVPDWKQSFVTSYLKAMLQAIGLPTDLDSDKAVSGESEIQSNELTAEQLEATLKDICGRICSKPNTRSGLEELYIFQQEHPSIANQIDSYLEQLGGFFYKYIKRNLHQIDMEHRMKHNEDIGQYRTKLNNLQEILTSATASSKAGGLVMANAPVEDPFIVQSPVRTRLESPLLKVPFLSFHSFNNCL